MITKKKIGEIISKAMSQIKDVGKAPKHIKKKGWRAAASRFLEKHEPKPIEGGHMYPSWSALGRMERNRDKKK